MSEVRLIDAEALKNYARKVLYEKNTTNFSLLKVFDEIIDNAPTVEERPQGEWIDVVCEHGCFFHGTCSLCKRRNDIPPPGMANFCPSCGAEMRKGDES